MAVAPGTRVGPYEIVAPLGAGGMGEVYRARDTRLGRDVALKALPAAFAQDPARVARFEREAKLLASLSHPNIAVVFGLEEVDGARYLAMELIEGETLADRLAHGALRSSEALEVLRQIAAGLEAAHESDVVHRDLKPGNVMITPAGDVKVLDFGLARSIASDRTGSDPGLSASPTMTFAATNAGVILGTAAYMSPEQARGRAVDKRTDVWSFGCVMFECLTGRQAFAGETVSDIVARILQGEPEWDALPGSTPERLRALLARCLEKDAKRRLRDIGDARFEIEDLIALRKSSSGEAGVATAGRARTVPWPVIALAAVLVAAAALAPRLFVRPAPPAAVRLEVRAPKGHFLVDGGSIALSPDGKLLAMIASDSSNARTLWVRRLDELTPRQLPGTDGVNQMFWSPDSRSLAFFARDEVLSKIAVDNGSPERICATRAARGGTWGRDGTILFAPYSNGGIFRVSASGGTPVQVTRPDSAHGVTGHRFPILLPDSKHFLFDTIPADADGKGGICVGTVDGGPTREIARGETGPAWAGHGWLLTTRNAALVAQRFDDRALRFVGDPVVIGDPLVGSQFAGSPVVSVSEDGIVAYLTREDVPVRAEWYDFDKQRVTGTPPLAPGLYIGIAIAPDDHHASILQQTEPTRTDLLYVDLDRGVTSKITQPPESPGGAAFSRDGTLIAYSNDENETIRVRSLVDGSLKTYLADDHAFKRVYAFMPDGKALVYGRLDAATKWDIWLLPLDGGPPRALLATPANETSCGISPDGRWITYQSDESGPAEACIAPFATPGLKYQVTIGGGVGGFAYDGKRYLFALTREPDVIHGADIRTQTSLSLGPSRLAFRLPPENGPWDLAHDDHRMLRLVPTEKPAPQAVTILQHWASAVRKP
jgi:serine/threonine protein kinase